MEPDTLYDLFLSYSEKDRLIAEALVERLKKDGVRYWWAPETLQGGTNYQEVIARDIPRCRLLLLLLSDKAGYSNHVKREVMIAMEEGKPILPVRIENVEPPVHLRYALTGEHRLDAFPKFREHLNKIADALLSLLESLRRETPVVRLLEPADGDVSARGAPLRVIFEVVPGADRRVKRVRLELRRDGTLLHHRALAESEIDDRGGRHEVEWRLPEALADGGRFQLAVLASDNNGQEGSAQMQGSFALGVAAPSAGVGEIPKPEPVEETRPETMTAVDVKPEPVQTTATPLETVQPPSEPVMASVAPERRKSAATSAAPRAAQAEVPRSPVPSARPAPSLASRVAGGAFAALFGVGAWSLRLVWVLALTGAAAGLGHHWLEPLSAVQKTHMVPVPDVYPVTPGSDDPDSLFYRPREPGSAAARMVKESAAKPSSELLKSPGLQTAPERPAVSPGLKLTPDQLKTPLPAPAPGRTTDPSGAPVLPELLIPPAPAPSPVTPKTSPFMTGDLRTKMLQGAGLTQPAPGLGRFNPDNWRNVKGPREPGRPIMALINIVRRTDKYSIGWHAPIPPYENDKVTAWTAIGRGAGLGAMLGLVAGIVAGLLAFLIAAVRSIPLAMLPLVEEKTFWSDFGIVVIVAGLTILDTGAKQPDSGRWSTPLFWWVAGLTIFCLLASQTVHNAANYRRQRAMLG